MARSQLYTIEQCAALVEWVQNTPLPVQPVRITKWAKITNMGAFITTQLQTIAIAKPLSLTWVGAVERLDLLKKFVENGCQLY